MREDVEKIVYDTPCEWKIVPLPMSKHLLRAKLAAKIKGIGKIRRVEIDMSGLED